MFALGVLGPVWPFAVKAPLGLTLVGPWDLPMGTQSHGYFPLDLLHELTCSGPGVILIFRYGAKLRC